MSPRHILSIGEAMLELSSAGQADLWRLGIAGDTFNTAWYLRRLLAADWRVGYLSRVGEGEFSQKMLDFLQAEGIETSHVLRDPAREIGLYAISLKNGERSFSYWRDRSAAKLLAEDPAALDRALEGCGIAYFSGISVAILSDAGRENLAGALARARARGTRIVFDPNLRPRLWPDAAAMRAGIEAAASGADLVLPSYDDEATHFGDVDADATIRRYLSLGAGHVVVKNGGGPMRFGGSGGQGTLSDLAPETPVDTTAAGDSFNAGYLTAMLRGADCATAIRAGHALSRQVIRHPGALVPAAIPAAKAEIDSLL
ncbi:2-dehydro-3-deoxygluconokinase [Paracoccus halophilus]|uniref:2-dehydro-3-deoxygluconokinase n=1 Tax=Paracoccus halophilus TaxID=376733 RepID=A0A1I0TMG9_9RHOB|nr:sugar kinase [Paracoccus halophilus]SFA52945.1 2-dehydro-3-deoxygluconokinase [Paracoccus halophilus]